MKSLVFKTMHQLIALGFNQSEALTIAWKRCKLTSRLKAGITEFSYVKSNGEIRKAIGTTNTDHFEYVFKTDGTRKVNPKVVSYYDIEKSAWRSCKSQSIVIA